MDAVNSETMKQYFALLSDVMTEHGLHSNPSNVDETGIPFDPRPPNVVTTKGTKKSAIDSQAGRGKSLL